MPKSVNFYDEECDVYFSRYLENDRIAIMLSIVGTGEPMCTATVCTEDNLGESEHELTVIKDYSENKGILKVLVDAGIVRDTGRTVACGWVEGNVVEVLETALPKLTN